MHQTKKGKQWYFGMKAHVGVDSKHFEDHPHGGGDGGQRCGFGGVLPGPIARRRKP